MRRLAAAATVALAIGFGGAAAADGPPVVARSAVDRGTIAIGDQILLTVTVDLAPGYELLDPGVPRAIGDFEIVEALTALQSRMPGGATRVELRYLATTFALGPRLVPVIVVGYRAADGTTGEASTPGALEVTVRSVIAAGEDVSDIKPLKPPLPIPGAPNETLMTALAAAAAAVVLVILVVVVLRARGRGVLGGAFGPGAGREALAELERIGDLRLVEAGRPREHYDLVAAAVRRFVAARYGIAAEARTVRELRRDLDVAGAQASAAQVLCAVIAQAETVRYEERAVSVAQAKRSLDDLIDVMRRSIVAEEYEMNLVGAPT